MANESTDLITFDLNHSAHPLVRSALIDGYFSLSSPNKDNLQEDAKEYLLDPSFVDSREYHEFKRDLKKGKTTDQLAIREFLKNRYLQDYLPRISEEYCTNLVTHWKSAALTWLYDVMSFHVDPAHKLTADLSFSLGMVENQWQLTSKLSNFALQDEKNETYFFPGFLNAVFCLDTKGLKCLHTNTNNPLFKELCCSAAIKKEAWIEQQNELHYFQQAITFLEIDINACKDHRKDAADAILKELKRLQTTGEITLTTLTDIAETTSNLLRNKFDEIEHFKELIAEIEKISIAKLLGTLMLGFVGLIVTFASTAGLIATSSSCAPLSVPGLVIGIGALVASGILLFHQVKKKPLAIKAEAFLEEVNAIPAYNR